MKFLFRTCPALLCFVFLGLHVVAEGSSVRPVHTVFPHLAASGARDMIRTVDSFLSASIRVLPVNDGSTAGGSRKDDAVSSRGRICSCQILNLSSANYDHRHIAILAEKTNNGSSADFSLAKNRIEKEKKQLRRQFYDKVKTVSSSNAVGSCHSMVLQLKSGDRNLQVYEILDADIH